MTDKAYIVANEQQEREVLEKLERWGAEWFRSKGKPTDFIPSHVDHITKLPYALLVENDQISWCDIEALYEFDDIVYDGRKREEEQMSDKYVVSQEFMNELVEWRKNNNLINIFVGFVDLGNIPEVVKYWWKADMVDTLQTNNRLIAILRWVNGEDVFEIEKPKKWVVRSKETDSEGSHLYLFLGNHNAIPVITTCFGLVNATKFGTKEEAESWVNAHQEVIEVEG